MMDNTISDMDFFLPFNELHDDEFELEEDETGNTGPRNSLDNNHASKNYEELNLKTFSFSEHKPHELESNIDPENNFYNSTNSNCEYYTDEQFKCNVSMDGSLSIIHFNGRSLYRNFIKIKDYLNQFSKFSVIAVSESWLTYEKETDVELEDYELFTTNRINRNGGGVALYVHNSFKCKKIESMSITVENTMEMVTVEIITEKNKNIIISCVYRTPGSCLDIFNDKMSDIYDKNVEKKRVLVCGDFNIDLLNTNEHRKSRDFLNTMYCLSLFPTILKPTRITTNSATLIDNIFINVIESEVVSGMLLNDITDHLPVFTIVRNVTWTKTQTETKWIRKRTSEALDALERDLSKQNCVFTSRSKQGL